MVVYSYAKAGSETCTACPADSFSCLSKEACTPYTVCKAGETEISAGTSVSDRICANTSSLQQSFVLKAELPANWRFKDDFGLPLRVCDLNSNFKPKNLTEKMDMNIPASDKTTKACNGPWHKETGATIDYGLPEGGGPPSFVSGLAWAESSSQERTHSMIATKQVVHGTGSCF